MEVSWYCWVTVISLVTNFHGCLCWPTLQPPLRPVTSKHELDSDESRKVLGSSVVTSVSVIMDHGNGTKTFLSDGIENPELKTNIIGSPGNLLNPDKYEFYTFDETGDLVKRLMTWDEIQGLIAGGEGEGIVGEASMPMYYSDSLQDKMGSTHITANDFQTSDIQGVHKVVESVQNVLKSELAASQSKTPPVVKPAFISHTPNWSLFLPSILDNAEDGSELNNLPGMLVSPSAHYTSMTTGMETNEPPNFPSISSATEFMTSDFQNATEVPTTNSYTEMTTTPPPLPPSKETTKKTEKPNRHKTTTFKPSTLTKNTFTPPLKASNRPTSDSLVLSSTPANPFKKYTTTKYNGSSNNDFWVSTTTAFVTTSKKNDHWYSTSSTPTTSLKNNFWHLAANTEPTTSKKTDFWYSTPSTESTSLKRNDSSWPSTTVAIPTSSKKTFTSSKYGGYLTNEGSTSGAALSSTRRPLPVSNKFGEYVTTDKYGWPSAVTESTSTSRKALTTSKYGGFTTNNELFASIASVLNQVTNDAKPTGSLPSSHPIAASKPASTTQFKLSTESNQFSTANKFQNMISADVSTQATTSAHKIATESARPTVVDNFKTASSMQHKFSAEPTRFTVSSFDTHRPASTSPHKLSTDKASIYQHKFSTESYHLPENRKTIPPFSKFTSIPNKYFTHDPTKSGLPIAQKISVEPTKYSTQSALLKPASSSSHIIDSTKGELVTSTKDHEILTSTLSSGERSPDPVTSSIFSNYVPLSTSALHQNDGTTKPTKTYGSSTTIPSTHVTLQKQPLTMKPVKPTKATTLKSTPKPQSNTFSTTIINPYSSSTSFTVTEKPLVRISTLGSTLADPTTTHPETLVTWISTFPLDETPSKVALNGVFDSDKLVTEQYVSSHHNRYPIIDDFFKNLTTAGTVKESATAGSLSTSTAASTIDNRPETSTLSSKLHTTLSSSNHNHYPPSLSTIFEPSRPFRTSERPTYNVESKTEPVSPSTYVHRQSTSSHHSTPSPHTSFSHPSTSTHITSTASQHSIFNYYPTTTHHTTASHFPSTSNHTATSHPATTSNHQIVHTVPTEYTEVKVFKTTTSTTTSTTTQKPVTLPVASSYNFSASETVMQRVPTINPPSKLHPNHVGNGGQKSSTKPQYLSTESIKNITQIAVMVNKFNETHATRLDQQQQRNKVTSRPNFESTKPINMLLMNDCITSLISNLTTESGAQTSATSSHAPSSTAAATQKENSHIYYYKLPSITSSPQHELHAYHHKATSTSTTSTVNMPVTKTVEDMPQLSPPAVPLKSDISDTTLKSTTEKEYQKITTVNHPGNDVIQNGISAVTNILLQTEGRVPNKEFAEFDGGSSTTGTATTITSSSTSSRLTTEHTLRTDQQLLQTRSATTNSTTNYSATGSTPLVASKPAENHTTTPQIQSASPSMSPVTESTSSTTLTKATNKTGSSTTQTTTANRSTASTNFSTTTEYIGSTDTSNEQTTTAPFTTTISSDFRNEFVPDDRNITQEEEEDIKNYHPFNYSSVNRSGNVIKNSTSTAAPTPTTSPTEAPKLKISPTSGSTLKPSTNDPKSTPATVRSTTWTTTISSTATSPGNVKAENKTKVDNKTEAVTNGPPPSAFRSPSGGVGPTQKTPPVTSTTGPGVELHPAPHESMGLEASVAYLGDDVKRFIDFCNELSFKIWTSQTGKSLVTSRSIVLSPFAVLSTLAMIFLGARGSSSGIMNDFLRLDDMVTFNPHQVLQNITESVVNSKNIGVANAAFVREIFSDKAKGKVLDFYKERLQQYYDTHVEEISFNIIGDLVRRRTNLLIKRQTQGKIQEYLRGSALALKPPLAVLTANVFQTDCDAASIEGRDGEMYFVVRPSTRQRRLVPIPAVVYRSGFLAGYEPGLDATAVTLNPESAVSTILVLPGQQGQVAPGDGLARLEQRLLESSYRRGAWSRLLRSLLFRPGLELQIPRFSHKSVLNLTAGLQKMGMAEIFTSDKADLRGINGVSNELHLSDIVQVNTFSTCGEETVDARHHIETYPSSPQRVGRVGDIFDHTFLDDGVNNYYSSLPLNLRPRQARLPDNPRLRFDRPFLYIVRHNPTGLILYIGRFNPRLLP